MNDLVGRRNGVRIADPVPPSNANAIVMSQGSPVSPHAYIAVNAEHLAADLGGEVVIMGVETGGYYGLDEVGAFVWRLLAQPRTFKDIVTRVLDEFDAEAATVECDLARFFGDMKAEGLVSISAEPESA